MASICAGVSVTWGGASLDEVVDVKINAAGSLPLGRDSVIALDAGTIEILSLSASNLGLSQRGLKKTLAFTGGGLTCSTKAILQTFATAGKVNDVARYTSTFKIVME
jgi:hypothetical protein